MLTKPSHMVAGHSRRAVTFPLAANAEISNFTIFIASLPLVASFTHAGAMTTVTF